ncbi:hypothetical protein CRG98_030431 [Punica granatum]|uniref:Uncharacterized protein n=1 Tax=Punica granatum TaxID=22663 RepID=A0A2I0IZK8_PUNGR|nr:hypothetical protein CRG98_030431 [Punica granatum]
MATIIRATIAHDLSLSPISRGWGREIPSVGAPSPTLQRPTGTSLEIVNDGDSAPTSLISPLLFEITKRKRMISGIGDPDIYRCCQDEVVGDLD